MREHIQFLVCIISLITLSYLAGWNDGRRSMRPKLDNVSEVSQ